ncbi:adenylyltransferase [Candidatus Kinetoplastibacterium crithidii (ex Angomonas deanei ATCC 30255)]|nr:HesA/MoeB/ThiF family protein [Candidatus Kinetoplastibacterium crithidii]AFZ82911.1 adenylyltransferase [Candidatus Kinetoplastibacterium crithidii (ex Angomonas deanei ATCC 30255)]
MNDKQLMRYARHILLENYGVKQQKKIMNSNILVVGLGGLGSSAVIYLASSGIGNMTLIDDDVVDISNLQRQILHNSKRVGQLKVDSARKTILDLNPEVNVTTFHCRVNEELLNNILDPIDIVLDCSDNFETRYLLNRMCFKFKKILVSGAAIRFSGQVSVYDLRDQNNPCYNCLFPSESVDLLENENCSTTGVFAPLVGIVGSIQASEAMKILAGIGSDDDSLIGKLLRLNILDMTFKTSKFDKDNNCLVCRSNFF